MADRGHEGHRQGCHGAEHQPRHEERWCQTDRLVVDDLGWALHPLDDDGIAGRTTRRRGEGPVRRHDDPLEAGERDGRRDPGTDPHEGQIGPGESRIGPCVDGGDEWFGQVLERKQQSVAHGGVVGDGAGEPDGGECCRADDTEARGRDVDRRVAGSAERDGDVLADALVQLRHGGGAEHHPTGPLQPVSREDGRRHGRRIVLHQEGNLLSAQLKVVVGGTRIRLDVLVVLQHRERNLRDLSPTGPDGVEGVGPVPPVERRSGDQRLQAVAERQRRDDERHRQHRTEERRAHGHGGPALAGLQRHADPDHTGSGEAGARHRCHDPRP